MTGTEATVLVVDDDPMLREALAEQLMLLGHRVATAPSAEAALEALDGGLAADLVLSDVHMGRTSGVELCAQLKMDPRWVSTPVILLSAAADLHVRGAGLVAGADDFFTKPFAFAELRARVASLLRARSLSSPCD
jgi:DNA-binding response OmpR family regulator